MKGVDIEDARRQKLSRLDEQVEELQKVVNEAHDISIMFSREVLREFNDFQLGKTLELKEFLSEHADNQVEFYRKVSILKK
jgi:sorting nexin-4